MIEREQIALNVTILTYPHNWSNHEHILHPISPSGPGYTADENERAPEGDRPDHRRR